MEEEDKEESLNATPPIIFLLWPYPLISCFPAGYTNFHLYSLTDSVHRHGSTVHAAHLPIPPFTAAFFILYSFFLAILLAQKCWGELFLPTCVLIFLTRQENGIQDQIFCCFGHGKTESKVGKKQLVYVANRPPYCEVERLISTTQSKQRGFFIFFCFSASWTKKMFIAFFEKRFGLTLTFANFMHQKISFCLTGNICLNTWGV